MQHDGGQPRAVTGTCPYARCPDGVMQARFLYVLTHEHLFLCACSVLRVQAEEVPDDDHNSRTI